MYAFEYHRPTSLAEVTALLSKAEDGKLLAGGQTYIPTLKQRLARPSDVIDLGRIAELKGIREEGGAVVIGAMATHAEVTASDIVRRINPGLAELAGKIGDPQVRARGTLGGSLANNDPAADYPAAVLALNATVHTNTRTIAADDFFQGMFETALEPGEIITAVRFPKADKAAYEKFRHPASRYAVVGVMVARTGGQVRVGVTGAAPCAYRWTEAEQALSSNWNPSAVDGLTVDPSEMNSDLHASSEYRAHLVKVMTKRAVEAAG